MDRGGQGGQGWTGAGRGRQGQTGAVRAGISGQGRTGALRVGTRAWVDRNKRMAGQARTEGRVEIDSEGRAVDFERFNL